MITALAMLFAFCPVGTIDQVEGTRMAVLGSTGVHVVATRAVEGRPYEASRVELGTDGRCFLASPDRAITARIEARLRDLRSR